MTNIDWPDALQQYINSDSFDYKFGDTLIRTDTDTGPQKVRSRFTKGIDTLSVVINVYIDEYAILEEFYKVTLANGSRTFNFIHPISGATIEVRFTDVPDISALGGLNFQAKMDWEVMP